MPQPTSGERAQSMILIVLMLTVLIGFLALVLDGGLVFAHRRQMQNAADAAALATARALLQGGQTDTAIAATIREYLQANGWNSSTGSYEAWYIDGTGTDLAAVGNGTIPGAAKGTRVVPQVWVNALLASVVDRRAFIVSAQSKAVWGMICGISGCAAPMAFYQLPFDPGQELVQNVGAGYGNFGWVDWGDSAYSGAVEVSNRLNHLPGCDPTTDTARGVSGSVIASAFVEGDPGAKNSSAIRDAMVSLIDRGLDFYVPLWDYTEGHGAVLEYHLSGFARVRATGWCSPGFDYPTNWAGGGCAGNWLRIMYDGPTIQAGHIGECTEGNTYGVSIIN